MKQSETKKKEIAIYKWIDQLGLSEPSLHFFINNFGTDSLKTAFKKSLKSGELGATICDFNKEWKFSRKNYIEKKKNPKSRKDNWVNP